MFGWIDRIVYISDIGRWHARAGYPREDDFVELPVHVLVPDVDEARNVPARADRGVLPVAANEADVPAGELKA